MNTIAVTASGFALSGPLVAGEKVAVTVSGLSLAAEDKPTLALLARFPDALLASVELAEDAQTPGTWTGELDTATKQTALFFATARADERRDASLELVAGRASLARLTVPMANSALCPKPDGSSFVSPVYVPVPGPPGPQGEPGPTRSNQYSFTVSDSAIINVHPKAASIVLETVEFGSPATITIIPPELPLGVDRTFYVLGANTDYSFSITFNVVFQGHTASGECHKNSASIVFFNGSQYVVADLGEK